MFGTTFSSPLISGLAAAILREVCSAEPTAAFSNSRWLLHTTELVFNVIESAARSGTTNFVSNVPILPDWLSRTRKRMRYRPGASVKPKSQLKFRDASFSASPGSSRSEEHTSELQSLRHLVC